MSADGILSEDGQKLVRVLNARASVELASDYDPNYPYQVYRPASDNYTELKLIGTTWKLAKWYYDNIWGAFNWGYIEDWTYNDAGPWAGSTVAFKNRELWYWRVVGVPRLEEPKRLNGSAGPIISVTVNNGANANQTGWVGGQQFYLSP